MHPAFLHTTVFARFTRDKCARHLNDEQVLSQHWDFLHLGCLQRIIEASSILLKPLGQLTESQNGFPGMGRQGQLKLKGYLDATNRRL